MKRKLFIVLLTCACTFCLTFGIAGCKQGDGGNDDALKGYIYKCSQTEHWQVNLDGKETARSPHNVVDGICQTCGYVEKCTEGLEFTEIKENEETIGYEVSRGTSTDSYLYIPSFYNDLPVIAIEDVYHDVHQAYAAGCLGREVFSNIKNLISVTIGNNVTYIGREAFADCENLESITIPNSITFIGEWAFYNCTNLESVTIGNGVTSIGNDAFYGCTSLTSITIQNSVTSIGNDAFSNTAYYNNPNNWINDVLYIDNYLIKAKWTLSGSYEIRKGTKLILDYAFYGCTSLTSITIPNSITSIGREAFSGCASLTSITVADNNRAYSSQDEVLFNKDKTELIRVPQTKTSITIPESVTSIGNEAFYGCTSLTSITIPNSVTSIGEWAFEGCTAEIKWGDNPSIKEIDVWAFSRYKGISITIPESITSIGDDAFSSCTSLINITIPDGVTSIGRGAFQFCTSLESVIFENPNGWYCAGYFSDAKTDIPSEDLINHATAASYLKETYSNCLWERKTA